MFFLLAQTAATVPATSDTTYVVYAVIAALVGWFLKTRLGINIPLLDKSPADSVPFPDSTIPSTNRPILDWMATVLATQYGKNPKVAAAIQAEIVAIKAILDAASIPSPVSGVPK